MILTLNSEDQAKLNKKIELTKKSIDPTKIYHLILEGWKNPEVVAYYEIRDGKTQVFNQKNFIDPDRTLPQIEFDAMIFGLETCNALGIKKVIVRTKLEAVYKIMKKNYEVSSDNIITLYERANEIIENFFFDVDFDFKRKKELYPDKLTSKPPSVRKNRVNDENDPRDANRNLDTHSSSHSDSEDEGKKKVKPNENEAKSSVPKSKPPDKDLSLVFLPGNTQSILVPQKEKDDLEWFTSLSKLKKMFEVIITRPDDLESELSSQKAAEDLRDTTISYFKDIFEKNFKIIKSVFDQVEKFKKKQNLNWDNFLVNDQLVKSPAKSPIPSPRKDGNISPFKSINPSSSTKEVNLEILKKLLSIIDLNIVEDNNINQEKLIKDLDKLKEIIEAVENQSFNPSAFLLSSLNTIDLKRKSVLSNYESKLNENIEKIQKEFEVVVSILQRRHK